MLPSEKQLADTYGVGRDAVRQGIAALRAEGLAGTVKGQGTFVRARQPRESVELMPGSSVVARMPTEPERVALGLDDGTPVLEILGPDGQEAIRSADGI